jgi:heme-binding protein
MFKRAVLVVGLVLVVGFLGAQAIPYGRAHSNPPVQTEPAWDSPTTRALTVTACFDCHSNETEWPWYSNIAPVSWLVQSDVDRGREALNFSQWGGENEGGDAAERVQDGTMPPFSYTLTHPDAALSEADRDALIRGLVATFGGDSGGGDSGGGGDE